MTRSLTLNRHRICNAIYVLYSVCVVSHGSSVTLLIQKAPWHAPDPILVPSYDPDLTSSTSACRRALSPTRRDHH